MSRARVTVHQLANEGGIEVEIALLTLMDSGIDVQRVNDFVPRSKFALARRALGLPAVRDLRSFVEIAKRASITELELRTKLKEAGIVQNSCEKRIPRRRLSEERYNHEA